MAKRLSYFTLLHILLLGLSACNSGSLSENKVDLSVDIGVEANLDLVNSNRLDIRFGDESTWSKSPRDFIRRRSLTGWSAQFNFPASGTLTATACQSPNLIGVSDIHISEGPKVSKYLKLKKATKLDTQVLEPSNKRYLVTEFAKKRNLRFEVRSNEKAIDVLIICSVQFSHSPNNDFTPYFTLGDNEIFMKEERLSFFELHLADSNADKTEVTIMGVANINEQLVGFTTSVEIKVE